MIIVPITRIFGLFDVLKDEFRELTNLTSSQTENTKSNWIWKITDKEEKNSKKTTIIYIKTKQSQNYRHRGRFNEQGTALEPENKRICLTFGKSYIFICANCKEVPEYLQKISMREPNEVFQKKLCERTGKVLKCLERNCNSERSNYKIKRMSSTNRD